MNTPTKNWPFPLKYPPTPVKELPKKKPVKQFEDAPF